MGDKEGTVRQQSAIIQKPVASAQESTTKEATPHRSVRPEEELVVAKDLV